MKILFAVGLLFIGGCVSKKEFVRIEKALKVCGAELFDKEVDLAKKNERLRRFNQLDVDGKLR